MAIETVAVETLATFATDRMVGADTGPILKLEPWAFNEQYVKQLNRKAEDISSISDRKKHSID